MNYQLKLEEIINNLDNCATRPKLLLHACCAPCSSYCIEYLSKYFDITIYYYNPNIDTQEEFDKRVNELNKFVSSFKVDNPVKIVVETYDNSEFETAIKGREDDLEGSNRCFICYELRMDKAASYAKENNFDYFTTTLSISPYKNANKLNEIGEKLEKKYGIKYLYADFKKKNGYRRSIELSKEYGLYRQDYCGCKYSKIARDKREELKREKLVKDVNKKQNETLIKKEMTISKNVILSILIFALAFLFTRDFPISKYSSELTNSSNSHNKIDNTITENVIPNNTIEKLIIEEKKANIDELYIYGQRLNIRGNIELLYEDIKDVNLKIKGKENEIDVELKYELSDNNINYYIADKINNGFVLDNLLIDKYDVYLEIITEYKKYYHKLFNNTDYKETTYYSVIDNNERKKIVIKSEEDTKISVISNSSNDIYDIVIDPGHGGSDRGACYKDRCETDFTLMLSKLLKKKLEGLGYNVALTRIGDYNLTNYGETGRIDNMHNSNAKLGISVHLNDFTKGTTSGVEIYTPGNVDYTFARKAIKTIKDSSGLDYSKNTFCKVEEGIYTRLFSETDIKNVANDAISKNYTAFEVSLKTNYYYQIRESGGYITGAYADGRDNFGANSYVRSNKGIETYILELGYMKVDSDIKAVTENKEIIMTNLAATIDKYLKN